MGSKKAMVAFVMLMMFMAAEAGLQCNEIQGRLVPCFEYLTNRGRGKSNAPAACCNGLKSILRSSKTTAARRSACECLKTSLKAAPININPSRAAALPADCRLNIPYKISPQIQCSDVK